MILIVFFNHFYSSEGFKVAEIEKGGEVGIIGEEVFGVGIHAMILEVEEEKDISSHFDGVALFCIKFKMGDGSFFMSVDKPAACAVF